MRRTIVGFQTEEIKTDGAVIHVRKGGQGPAVVLLHGFGDTGDMWAPLAALLAGITPSWCPICEEWASPRIPKADTRRRRRRSTSPESSTISRSQKADLVTHDIGNMVGYAFAAQYPERVTRWVAMDAPLPGIGPWDEIIRSPALWHFNFRGPDVERLVAGRERIYLDRFWNELSANPTAIDEATREHYAALYARPGAMHSAFSQFAAFPQDAIDNRRSPRRGKLTMPCWRSAPTSPSVRRWPTILRFVATDVSSAVIPDSGHWLMESSRKQTTAAIVKFIEEN